MCYTGCAPWLTLPILGPYRETVFSTSGGGGGKCHQLMRLKVTIFGAKITPRAKLALGGGLSGILAKVGKNDTEVLTFPENLVKRGKLVLLHCCCTVVAGIVGVLLGMLLQCCCSVVAVLLHSCCSVVGDVVGGVAAVLLLVLLHCCCRCCWSVAGMLLHCCCTVVGDFVAVFLQVLLQCC